ncbi:unnamed protein product [Urochloa decumbens]|uniref:Uncharacterized protein n=1 Tax=Urochloa decumbens TaxID=240449 RepID=A0ABC9BQF6_9POAL
MATFMMKSRRSSVQGLLLLSLLVLAVSAIPAPISGESMIDSSGGRKMSKTAIIGADKQAGVVIHGDDVFNGCLPHDARASNFVCTKDNLNWPSLSECVINCPCKVRCNG